MRFCAVNYNMPMHWQSRYMLLLLPICILSLSNSPDSSNSPPSQEHTSYEDSHPILLYFLYAIFYSLGWGLCSSIGPTSLIGSAPAIFLLFNLGPQASIAASSAGLLGSGALDFWRGGPSDPRVSIGLAALFAAGGLVGATVLPRLPSVVVLLAWVLGVAVAGAAALAEWRSRNKAEWVRGDLEETLTALDKKDPLDNLPGRQQSIDPLVPPTAVSPSRKPFTGRWSQGWSRGFAAVIVVAIIGGWGCGIWLLVVAAGGLAATGVWLIDGLVLPELSELQTRRTALNRRRNLSILAGVAGFAVGSLGLSPLIFTSSALGSLEFFPPESAAIVSAGSVLAGLAVSSRLGGRLTIAKFAFFLVAPVVGKVVVERLVVKVGGRWLGRGQFAIGVVAFLAVIGLVNRMLWNVGRAEETWIGC